MGETGFQKFTRPQSLYPLFRRVNALPGIGTRLSGIIEKRIGVTIIDLLRHAPTNLIIREKVDNLAAINEGDIVTLHLTPFKHEKPHIARQRLPLRVRCSHDQGEVDLVFFHAKGDYFLTQLPLEQVRVVSGRAERFRGRLQITHPDYITRVEREDEIPKIEPVYPLTAGLTPKPLRKAILAALESLPALPEWIPDETMKKFNWPDWKTAMVLLHHPKSLGDLLPHHPARQRLAYDELLANQLALALVRDRSARNSGQIFKGDKSFTDPLLQKIPFSLTKAQERVIAEIAEDQEKPQKMLRLLQGDVGSGKTLVALMAMLKAIESGAQAALIAPTEILARQHSETITALLEPLGITPLLLVGKMKASEKKKAYGEIADGTAKLIIGTHALIVDDVIFPNLGIAVIDEQHRFGVRQRLILGQKSKGVDVLVMTATPIPRTLAMTTYGDLTSSVLDEKPVGRKDITTTVMPIERIDEIIARLRERCSPQQQAYWICPLIEESDAIDIAAAEDRFTFLKTALAELNPHLAHGRMKSDERAAAMESFRTGESQLLVSTTVVEVGVDVPNATIMIIEHAERFGLAQLHQLRGRVGRSETQSSCILLYKSPLGIEAKARLSVMRETNDGFRIAEEDLKLRGAGEVLGQRQSGDPEFVLADLAYHTDLLLLSAGQVETTIAQNLDITGEDGEVLRTMLALFEREHAVTYLAGG